MPNDIASAVRKQLLRAPHDTLRLGARREEQSAACRPVRRPPYVFEEAFHLSQNTMVLKEPQPALRCWTRQAMARQEENLHHGKPAGVSSTIQRRAAHRELEYEQIVTVV